MFSLVEIFIILLTHWVSDFVFQTHWQATNKSKNNLALTMHVLTYSIGWLIPMGYLFYINGNSLFICFFNSLFFSIYTFIFHWLTDYATSRLNSYLWAKGDVHNFFVSVGFDQILHYLQIFLFYYYIKSY